MSVPLKPDDPAFFLLENGPRSIPQIFKAGCYICEDIEFALMGLPLCYPCKYCQGHVAADDTICDECGKDQHDDTES
jgi:hypothetical protein